MSQTRPERTPTNGEGKKVLVLDPKNTWVPIGVLVAALYAVAALVTTWNSRGYEVKDNTREIQLLRERAGKLEDQVDGLRTRVDFYQRELARRGVTFSEPPAKPSSGDDHAARRRGRVSTAPQLRGARGDGRLGPPGQDFGLLGSRASHTPSTRQAAPSPQGASGG